ncbi:MAG TPA: glycosyltransferase family 4 protein [Bacteroidia bacterium]|nr:glycosyltransferase family 4 protein [Bacteroidia bacterium]
MSRRAPHIAVVSINRDKYSETFIQDAFDALPCRKTLLYGGYLPTAFTADWRLEGEVIPTAKPAFWEAKPATSVEQQAVNLRKWLKSQKVDAILANYGPSGVAMVPVAAALKLPLIVHFHGYDAYRQDILESYGRDYPEMFALASALVVVSADMQAQLLRLGAPAAKLHTYIYGVDLGRFAAQPFPAEPFTFVFVGRFVPKKAPLLLLRAFAKIHALLPAVRLRCVGDGELWTEAKQLVQNLGLAAAVEFHGALPHAAVAAVLKAGNALVLPSQSGPTGDSEGTPLVVLEAAALGRPVIATRHGGIPDVVADEKTGILVAEGDEDALVNAMLRLAGNPEWAEELGKNAAELALERFCNESYHQKLWRLLSDLI